MTGTCGRAAAIKSKFVRAAVAVLRVDRDIVLALVQLDAPAVKRHFVNPRVAEWGRVWSLGCSGPMNA